MEDKKRLVFAFCEFLEDATKTSGLVEDNESLEVALQCLQAAFQINITDASQKKKYGNAGLLQIFQRATQNSQSSATDAEFEAEYAVYVETLEKKGYFKGCKKGDGEYERRADAAREKLLQNRQARTRARAEELKEQGNELLRQGQYEEAEKLYSQAIESGGGAICYCNRAAARTHLRRYEDVLADCDAALALDPRYGKAHSRRAQALYHLQRFAEAADSYRSALALQPDSASLADNLRQCERKLREQLQPEAAQAAARAGFDPSVIGGLSELMSNPAVAALASQLAGGAAPHAAPAPRPPAQEAQGGEPQVPPALENLAAGLPDDLGGLGGLLNNPAMLSMAENLMRQPSFNEILSNPSILNMAQEVMKNPNALNSLLSNFNPGGDK